MTLPTIIFFALSLIGETSHLSAQEWQKIVPLSTTRAQVESLLGPASDGF